MSSALVLISGPVASLSFAVLHVSAKVYIDLKISLHKVNHLLNGKLCVNCNMFLRPVKQYIIAIILVPALCYCNITRAQSIFLTTNGTISFSSEAPLELIRASSNELAGLLDNDKKTFSFKINIRSFEGFNSPLQREHFNENYMESDKFPQASFSGKIIEEVDFSKDGEYEVRAKGNLIIHGITQERIIKTNVSVKNKKITITGKFSVLLSEHNIPIPIVVYKKLANEIKVEVNTTLEPR
jgi:hypothetical protein